MVSPGRAIGILTAFGVSMVAASGSAEPYRLRADAFAQAPDPAAFAVIQAEAQQRGPLLFDAEALVWTGVALDAQKNATADGEAVLASVRMRDPAHGLGLKLGRVIYYGGAVRPLYFDGAIATARAPSGTQIEAFGGVPAVPDWEGRSFDWLVGGRLTQSAGERALVGVSYWQSRDEGAVAHSELGFEGALTPIKILALTGTAAIDTDRIGLADARVSVLLHDRVNRAEVFALRRSPSLMLPATSLFAALGSYDADQLGFTGSYRVAPRLSLSATLTVDRVAEELGATQEARAELLLDDDGKGAIGVLAKRTGAPGTSWTGARAWLRVPIAYGFGASAEVEVAVPDDPGEKGPVWPWGLVGLRYVPFRFIEAAAAVEASSSPEYDFSFGGLFRLSGAWGST